MKAVMVSLAGQWREQAKQALEQFWQGEICTAWLESGDQFGYAHVLAEHWSQAEDFAVIEPDIVIRADVDDAFRSCPEWYCAFPYAWGSDVGPALGCTRFRKELLIACPGLMQNVLQTRVSWRQVDIVLLRHLLARERAIQPHVHLPPVEHLNESKRLYPGANPTPLLEVPLT